MDRAYASNNPWASCLHPQSHHTSTNRQAYYGDELGQLQAEPCDYARLPTYEETVFEGPRLSSSEFRQSTHHQDTKEFVSEDTGKPLRTALDVSGEETLRVVLDFARQAPSPPKAPRRRLRPPVAIPQVIPGLGQPFARCYSNDLQEHGISMEDFVKFIDNLNAVSAGSPPLQIVDMAGGVVGMIPFHHAQLVSLGIQSVAKIGKAAISKTRGSMFLSKANEDFFIPRGLKVELVTSAALRYKLKMHLESPLAFDSEELGNQGLLERRVAALRGYTTTLTFDVPPPDQQTNILDKMSAAQQQRVIAKQEKKFIKERSKHAEKPSSSRSSSENSDSQAEGKRQKIESRIREETAKTQRKIEKINDEFDQKLIRKPKDTSKIERERLKEVQKIEKDTRKELEELEEKLEKADKDDRKDREKSKDKSKKGDKESKALNKIQWILVTSL